MRSSRFKPGDSVVARGTQWVMTVQSFDPATGQYRCVWPEGATIKRCDFDESELERFEPHPRDD